MADNFDNYGMKVQATASVKMPTASEIDKQIRNLEKSISKLQISGKLDDSSLKNLSHQLDTLKATVTTANFSPTALTELTNQVNRALQNINIGNINVGNIGNQAQQVGQQIGATIAQGVNSAIQKSGGFKSEYLFDGKNPQNKVTETVLKDFQKLSDGIVTVKEQMKSVGGKSFLDGFTVSIEHATGQVETLAYKLKDIEGKTGQSFQYTSGSINDNGVIKQMNAISAKADSLQTKLDKLKANYSDVNASRPIKDSGNISALSAQYDKVAQAIEAVRNADNSTFSSMASNAQKEITTLETMISQFRNAENVATQMKSVDISSGIAQATERLGKLKANASGFDQMTQTIQNLDTVLASVGDKASLDAFINDLRTAETQLSRVKAEAKQLENVNKIQHSWSDGSYEAKYDSLIAKTRQWVDANDESVISTQKLTTAYNEFNQAVSNFAKDGSVKNRDILIQKEEELGRQLKATTNDIKVQNAEFAKSSKVDSLHQKIQEFYDKNTATHRQWGGRLQNLLNETAHGAQVTATRVNEIEQEFLGVSNAARQAGKLGQSFFGSIKEQASKFVQWFSVTSVVMEGVQAIKKMTQEVIAVDSAMVELRKVSDASNNDLKNYFDESAKSAKDLGAAVSDVISATADWSRLGYSLDDSKKLAEVAILYKNVGDGIDVDTANESLVSTLRGFQLSAEDAMNIVDQFNEVANNFPIDSAGIGEALQRSAASFYEANTDLSKSIALITGTNSVIQDPDSVGTMWKTVSMRIRGATAELEEAGLETEGMVETTSQLQALVKGMTGFDIMKDEDTFKDIYEIVIGIGNEWQNLSDIEQASLLEALAGKRQGNALAAALNNISMIEDAYNTATNSAGSALEEQEEYEKGIQYSLDRLEAKFQEFSNHVLESELIKGIVDFGTTTLDVVDKVTSALGSLGTIGLGAGLFASFKGAGRVKIAYPHLYTYACRNKTLYA